MYLLDTDVLIWLLRGRKEVIEGVARLSAQAEISVSVITIAEVYQNIFPTELISTEEHISRYIHLGITTEIAMAGGLYWQEYSRSLRTLSLADCLIAATAFTYNTDVVTFNTKHFPMKEIKVVDPLKKSAR